MRFPRISHATAICASLALLGGCEIFRTPDTTLTSGDSAEGETLCCDANDNCSPAPPPPGVCPIGTITSVCDDDNNCVDEDLD